MASNQEAVVGTQNSASSRMDDELVMPVMAAIIIRSAVPELQDLKNERVLACIDLTWKEYLIMFNVELDAEDYIVRGVEGPAYSIDSKIGEYISSSASISKRTVHNMLIEKTRGFAAYSSTASTTPSPELLLYGSRIRRGPKRKKKIDPSPPPPPQLKLLILNELSKDTTALNSNTPAPDDTLVSDVEAIIDTVSAGSEKGIPATSHAGSVKLFLETRSDNLESSVHSERLNKLEVESKIVISPVRSGQGLVLLDASKSPAIMAEVQNTSRETPPLQNNVCQTASDAQQRDVEVEVVHESVQTASFVAGVGFPRGRKLGSRRNRNQRFPIAGSACLGRLDIDSSEDESIIARNPHRYNSTPQPSLKPSVIHFLANKVSNRDMLKVREELMKLKEHDDYFKVTSLTPLAAGLLEQMLCRSLPQQTS